MGLQPSAADFLSNIGADGLSPALTASAPPRHADLLERISAELEQLDLDAHAMLKDNWSSFTASVQQGRQLERKVERVHQDLDALEAEQARILPPLLSTLSRHAELAMSHAVSASTVTLLTTLADLHALIHPIVLHRTFSPELVTLLRALRSALSSPPAPWIAQTPIYNALTRLARDEDTRISSLLADALSESFILTKDPHPTLTLARPLEPLLDSLAVLSPNPSAVSAHLNRLAALVGSHLVVPLLASKGQLALHHSSATSLVLDPAEQSESPVLQSLSTLLSFLPRPIVPLLPIAKLLIVHHLSPLLTTSLPTSRVVNTIRETENFEPGVREWTSEVGKHWGRKVREGVLLETRELVRTWSWKDTETIDWPPHSSSPATPPPKVVPSTPPPKSVAPVRQQIHAPIPQRPPQPLPQVASPSPRQLRSPPMRSAPISPIKPAKPFPPTFPISPSRPAPPPIAAPKSARSPSGPSKMPLAPSIAPKLVHSSSISSIISSTSSTPSRAESRMMSPGLQLDAEHADLGDEEEDAWGLGSEELDMPAEEVEVHEPVSELPSRSPRSVQTMEEPRQDLEAVEAVHPRQLEEMHEDQHEGMQDDGWGFDDDSEVPDVELGRSDLPVEEEEEDGWGFGAEDEDNEEAAIGHPISPIRPMAILSSPPPPPALTRRAPATPSPPRSPPRQAQSPPQTQVRIAVPKGSRTISTSVRTLLKLVSSVEELERTITSSSYPYYDLFSSAAPILASTSSSILALYRATLPAAYGKLLTGVPTVALQFANDLDFLAEAPMTALARRWRADVFETQRTELMESLDAAEGFRYTGDPEVFARAERALDQVAHSLERVAGVWKSVMDLPSFYEALGRLVNAVLQRMLDEIEAQSDISEEESIALNTLCKKLHGLETLFGVETSVGQEVLVWFKFVFLSELLEASMVDIIFLFDNGHLMDFSNEEIERLVRALFADSPARKENLAHIARGSTQTGYRSSDSDDDDVAGQEDRGDDRWE